MALNCIVLGRPGQAYVTFNGNSCTGIYNPGDFNSEHSCIQNLLDLRRRMRRYLFRDFICFASIQAEYYSRVKANLAFSKEKFISFEFWTPRDQIYLTEVYYELTRERIDPAIVKEHVDEIIEKLETKDYSQYSLADTLIDLGLEEESHASIIENFPELAALNCDHRFNFYYTASAFPAIEEHFSRYSNTGASDELDNKIPDEIEFVGNGTLSDLACLNFIRTLSDAPIDYHVGRKSNSTVIIKKSDYVDDVTVYYHEGYGRRVHDEFKRLHERPIM